MGLRRRTPDVEHTELDVCRWDRNPSGPSPTTGHPGRRGSAPPVGDDAGSVPAADDAAPGRSGLDAVPARWGEGAAPGRSGVDVAPTSWADDAVPALPAKGLRPAGSRRRLIRPGALAAAGVLAAGLVVNAWSASRPLPEGRLRHVPEGVEAWTRAATDFVDARATPLTGADGELTGWEDASYEMSGAGDVVLLTTTWREETPGRGTQVHARLFALDAADGHTLWSRDYGDTRIGTGPIRAGDTVAVVIWEGMGSGLRLETMDLHTGTVRSRRTYPPQASVRIAAVGTDLAVVSSQAAWARVERMDPATAEARWTRRMTWPAEPPETARGYTEENMVGHVVVLADEDHVVVDHPHGATVFTSGGSELFAVEGEAVVPLGGGYLGANRMWAWQRTAPTGRVWTSQGRELAAVGADLTAVRSPQDDGLLVMGAGSRAELALLALDTRHGRVIWRAPKTSMSPVPAGDVVVDVAAPEGLTARGLWDGVERWQRPLDGGRAEDAIVYVSVVEPSSVSLHFDGDRIVHVGPAQEKGVTSVVSAYDATTGALAWTLALPCGQHPRSVVVDGTLVVGGDVGLVAMQ